MEENRNTLTAISVRAYFIPIRNMLRILTNENGSMYSDAALFCMDELIDLLTDAAYNYEAPNLIEVWQLLEQAGRFFMHHVTDLRIHQAPHLVVQTMMTPRRMNRHLASQLNVVETADAAVQTDNITVEAIAPTNTGKRTRAQMDLDTEQAVQFLEELTEEENRHCNEQSPKR